jgi:hypothetical protein
MATDMPHRASDLISTQERANLAESAGILMTSGMMRAVNWCEVYAADRIVAEQSYSDAETEWAASRERRLTFVFNSSRL